MPSLKSLPMATPGNCEVLFGINSYRYKTERTGCLSVTCILGSVGKGRATNTISVGSSVRNMVVMLLGRVSGGGGRLSLA